MRLRPRPQRMVEIDGIQFVPADAASLVLRNSRPTELTPGRSSGKSAGRALELKLHRELTETTLIVVTARSQGTESTF